MTKKLFAVLNVYREAGAHSAAMNMAVDEVLLERATYPVVRFYRWRSPALSFGYFGRFTDVASYQNERDLVRRWTGGGIVFHGADLTYSLVIPVSDVAFTKSSRSIYQQIHQSLCRVFLTDGKPAELLAVAAVYDCHYNDCFENPVLADVIIDGRKIAGAAQRRTRCGLLQQGSIQGIDLQNDLAQRFARELSVDCRELTLDDEILNRARELAEQKYGTDVWLRKR